LTRKPAADPRPNGNADKSGNVASLVEELRRRISEHEIAPGAKLKEQEIAKDFSVSRARVREAIAVLEMRGLVEKVPNRGAVARRFELDRVFEIYDVREVLEGLAVRCAVSNEDPQVWADWLGEFDDGFEQRILAGEIELYESEFTRLRSRIIEAAGNPVLTAMLDSVQDQTQLIMRRVLILPGRVKNGLEDLRACLQAMAAGNAEEAERRRRIGIRRAIDDLKRYQRFVL
jgi:DNA-binding GntR family transcriptional regulator